MDLITDLVIANRILATEDVVDAYGHVSVRNPDAPERFFLAHSRSPSLVEADDIVEHTLDGQAFKPEKRKVQTLFDLSPAEASMVASLVLPSQTLTSLT